MKIFFLFSLVLVAANAYSQDNKEYTITDAGVSYTRVIEADGKTKDALFDIVHSYFVYNYNDANSVIQTNDKASGVIVGKGIYAEIYSDRNATIGVKTLYSATHIVRVDCKDGKIRVILTLQNYDIVSGNWAGQGIPTKYQEIIKQTYPLIPQQKEKKMDRDEKVHLRVFEAAQNAVFSTFENIEKSVKSAGSTGLEDDKW